MKKLALIDNDDFKVYEEKILIESEAGMISKKLKKYKNDDTMNDVDYEKKKEDLLFNK